VLARRRGTNDIKPLYPILMSDYYSTIVGNRFEEGLNRIAARLWHMHKDELVGA
jgi:hypothetical protein